MGIFSFFGFDKRKEKIIIALNEGAVIVDVRSKGEFVQGHSKDAMNIPLDEIEGQVEKLRKIDKKIILVCASGMRSGSASSILKKHGIESLNGISWKKFD